MLTKKPHAHAEFLIEAAQDISRKIKGKHIRGDFFEEVTLAVVAGSDENWEFFFADTVVVSLLTDRQLFAIAAEHADCDEDINYKILRAVANAAAAKHDADIAKKQPPPLKGSPYEPQNSNDKDLITPEEREALYKNSGLMFQIF